MFKNYSPDDNKDKFYVNLNIQHGSKYTHTEASADFNFLDPILDRGGNFQMTVTDFQIDTRLIPILIAEIRYYQKYPRMTSYVTSHFQDRRDTYYELNYWVRVTRNYSQEDKIYLKRYVHDGSNAYANREEVVDGKKYYIYDNNHRHLYIYSYQEFLDMVNIAIKEAIKNNFGIDGYAFEFVIEDEKIAIKIRSKTLFDLLVSEDITNRIVLEFSPSLYKYLATGFPVYLYSDAWRLKFSKSTPMNSNVIYNVVDGTTKKTEKMVLSDHYETYTISQIHSSLMSWYCCKAIVIYSTDMPIAEEIFPMASVKDELAHYRSFNDSVTHMYTTANLKKKIIYIHYIDYNSVKSLSNGFSGHNECVDSGVKIDLEKTVPMNKFNVSVGWIDNFGNFFPLLLPYNGCCNVRICFTRRCVQEYYDYTDKYNVNYLRTPIINYDYYTGSPVYNEEEPENLEIEVVDAGANDVKIEDDVDDEEEDENNAELKLIGPPTIDLTDKDQFYKQQNKIINNFNKFANSF